MVLKIYSQIANESEKALLQFFGDNAVSFIDVDDFVSQIPEDDDSIEVRIHCPGGDVAEGWAIVDKLRATGKKIITVVDGVCSSMATIVLLAGSVRKGNKNQRLLIHNTRFCDFYIENATAEELEAKANDLRSEDNKILDFYVERTGADREVLATLMKEERYMSMQEAKDLGFITEIIEPISAISNTNKNKKNMSKKNLKDALNVLAQALGLSGAKDIELQTEDGQVLTVEREEGDPEVGDAASPDGEWLMPDGRTIIVSDGVITEIREAVPDGGEDVEALKAEIARLTAELESERAKGKSDEESAILAQVKAAGGKQWLDRVTTSNYVPPKPNLARKKEPVAEENVLEKELRERKEKAKAHEVEKRKRK